MMERYRFLKHEATADIAFIAYGKKMDELFENAAHAVYMTMIDKEDAKGTVTIKIRLSAENIEDLLIAFLNRIILYKDYKHVVITSTKVDIKNGYLLTCTAKAERAAKLKRYFRADVKAVTMHDLKIRKRNGLIECKVILDI